MSNFTFIVRIVFDLEGTCLYSECVLRVQLRFDPGLYVTHPGKTTKMPFFTVR